MQHLPANSFVHDTGQPLRVLVVDDSTAQRHVLVVLLRQWGFVVDQAASGQQALARCRAQPPDIVLSDWIMPGMDGLELCRLFRQMPRVGYGYFILLTSKTEKQAVAQGLDCGADDFLTKPVHPAELRARITAGARVLRMEREISSKSQGLTRALDELQGLYTAIDHDLRQARKIQQSLVPERVVRLGGTQVSMLLKPCGHIGGDLVGLFQPGQNRLGFFSIDVSGHGVTSALMTARLASYLSGRFLEQNIALEQRLGRFYALRPLSEVAEILNNRLLADTGVEDYFTMAYGIFDLRTGRLNMVQAGHPPPLIQRANGTIDLLGQGGMPIGLLPDAYFEPIELQLQRGDRVLLFSDGFSEAQDAQGQMLEEEGLAAMMARLAQHRGPDLLDQLFAALCARAPGKDMEDDVSAILLEYDGPEGPLS